MALDDDRAFLASTTSHPTRAGDTANMNPVFVTPLANAIRQARAEGINAGVGSGYRGDDVTGSAFDKAGYSAHGYGLASDISGIGVRGSDSWKRWNQIAQANGLNNPYLGTKAEGPEFNHWQLPPQPLNRMDPSVLAGLRAARATGDWNQVWNAYSTPTYGTTVNAPNTPIAGALSRPGTPTPGSSIGDYYHTTMIHESGGKNIPAAEGGGAGGYYQFSPSTWASIRAAHPELNLPDNPLSANLDQQTAATKALTSTNVEALTKAGIPINDKNVYMAHFLGPGGATKFITTLNQTPSASAADLFPAEAKANPGVFYTNGQPRTMSQVFEAQTGKQGSGNTTGFGLDAQPTDTASAAPAAAPAADKPWWQKAFDAPTDTAGTPVQGGKSPFQQAASALQGGDKGSSIEQFRKAQEEEAPEGTVKNQAGQAPGTRNVSPMGGALLPSVAQTYGQTINSLATPLAWNSVPPRAPQMPPAGLQGAPGAQVPGMTLTSFRAPQGIGYGVDPSIGYG